MIQTLRKTWRRARQYRPVLEAKLGALPGGAALLARLTWFSRRLREQRLHAAKAEIRRTTRQNLDAFMQGGARLRLPSSAHPRVSIVLVLWNQAPLTFACLQGLTRQTDVPWELIIVDNASSDATPRLLERVDGARVLRNPSNLHFLKAANQGVAECRGELVLLLNNDAMLRPGSLAAACETLSADASIGAVGGRIVLPHGRLQEAGSIIWNDGRCQGYARGHAPECGEAMFRRDVDYCSGVFLLFRRSTFEALGGLDEAFAPAYYEETDFCMRLWESGRRVVYEPRAVVDHLESGSATRGAETIRLQDRNRKLFAAKHAQALGRHLAGDPANILRARMHERGRGHVLVIDDRVPLQDLGAGFPRARQMLREIVDSGRFVTFLPIQFPPRRWEAIEGTLPPTVEAVLDCGVYGLEAFLESRRGYYDTLVVCRPHNMKPVVRLWDKQPQLFDGIRIVYDSEALASLRDAGRARLFGDMAALGRAEASVASELALARVAHAVIAVSEAEAEHFRGGAREVYVLGHCVPASPTPRPFAERRDLLFVGALEDETSPNVDSMTWFAREVLPRIEAELGQPIRLRVAGRNRARSVQALRGGAIDLLGPVDRLEPEYDRARVFVAPTRFGAGIPLKVVEAAAYGLPVVATSLLADQLGWRDGVELLAADDAPGFARQVARACRDAALWESLRSAALAGVARDFAPESFRRELRRALGD